MDQTKIEYNDLDIERKVLSILIQNPDKIAYVYNMDKYMFFEAFHRDLFSLVVSYWTDKRIIDYTMLKKDISKDHNDAWYLAEICTDIVNVWSFDEYVDVLSELHKQRECQKIAQRSAFYIERWSNEYLSFLKSEIKRLEVNKSAAYDFIDLYADIIDDKTEKTNMICGTGYYDLDTKIQWFREWQLVIVSARPWVGKTMFATNLMTKNIIDKNKAVFFSLEMWAIEITQRIMSKITKVPLTTIANKTYTQEQKDTLVNTYWLYATKYEPNIKIEVKSFDINDILMKIRSYNAIDWVKIFYIDQLQRIKAKGEKRVFEVERITNDLKNIASELWIVVILLCQINRSWANKEPELIHLKDSWSIEQDADVVLFPHVDEFESKNIKIIIAKNRNWSISECELWLNKDCMHIFNIDKKKK